MFPNSGTIIPQCVEPERPEGTVGQVKRISEYGKLTIDYL